MLMVDVEPQFTGETEEEQCHRHLHCAFDVAPVLEVVAVALVEVIKQKEFARYLGKSFIRGKIGEIDEQWVWLVHGGGKHRWALRTVYDLKLAV